MININGTDYPTMKEIWETSGFTSEEINAIKLKNDIIEALINIRENLGLTQKALAEACGVKQQYIARIETGETDPQISSIIKLLAPLGYTLQIMPTKK